MFSRIAKTLMPKASEGARVADAADELLDVADRLERSVQERKSPDFVGPLDKLEEAAGAVGKSWSGSWLGYHSRVYYDNLQPPPPGAHFSQEWGGTGRGGFSGGTTGAWREYEFDAVVKEIYRRAGDPALDVADQIADEAESLFEDGRSEVLSILNSMGDPDTYLSTIIEEAGKDRILSERDFVKYFQPTGQFMSRDAVAIGQGLQVPPHLSVLSKVLALRSSIKGVEDLSGVARKAGSHLARLGRKRVRQRREVGTSVFIGHGRSHLWRELKDFVGDRLGLPWDEFNRVPVAGITNVSRLNQMLDEAAVAFLVLAAEDEQADGSVNARLNVIHEAGLFQGRLGFTKAIVLLEEGCAEFSNIQGLGQIRFPKGNIKASFDDVRQVLEREGLA